MLLGQAWILIVKFNKKSIFSFRRCSPLFSSSFASRPPIRVHWASIRYSSHPTALTPITFSIYTATTQAPLSRLVSPPQPFSLSSCFWLVQLSPSSPPQSPTVPEEIKVIKWLQPTREDRSSSPPRLGWVLSMVLGWAHGGGLVLLGAGGGVVWKRGVWSSVLHRRKKKGNSLCAPG